MNAEKIKVLLVDDHTVARNGVKLMLSTADDIEVTGEAETAQDALQIGREQEFDVALVDIALPGKNGLELLKLLLAEHPKLAVLILSMYSEEIYAVRALKHGAAGYLTKNSPATTLVAAVRKAANGGKHVSPALLEKLASIVGGGRNMASHDALSDREVEVLKLVASGENLAKIAEMLHLSPSTIATYRARIVQKTGAKNNIELARYAQENGLLF